jgi:hypothetical protein
VKSWYSDATKWKSVVGGRESPPILRKQNGIYSE